MKVEIIDDTQFRFRLVADDGRVSGWAGYTSIAMLDGMCAMTAYYCGSESGFELTPITPEQALSQFAVCEEKGAC